MRPLDAAGFAIANIRQGRIFFAANVIAVGIGIVVVVVMLSLSSGMRRYATSIITGDVSANVVEVTRDPRDPRSLPITKPQYNALAAIPAVVRTFPVIEGVFAKLSNDAGAQTWASLRSATANDPELRGTAMLGGTIAFPNAFSAVIPASMTRELGIRPPTAAVGRTLIVKMRRTRASREENVDIPVVVAGIARNTRNERTYLTVDLMRWIQRWEGYQLDAKAAPTPEDLRQAGEGFAYDTLLLEAGSIGDVDRIRHEAERLGYRTTSVLDSLHRLDEIMFVVTLLLGTIGAISIIAGAASIFNASYAAVLRRTEELAVFKAFGATRVSLLLIVQVEAVITAAVAGGAGFSIAAITCIVLQRLTGARISFVLFPVEWWLLGVALGISLLTCIAASLAPAFVAARTNVITLFRQA